MGERRQRGRDWLALLVFGCAGAFLCILGFGCQLHVTVPEGSPLAPKATTVKQSPSGIQQTAFRPGPGAMQGGPPATVLPAPGQVAYPGQVPGPDQGQMAGPGCPGGVCLNGGPDGGGPVAPLPTELNPTSMPPYMIEPPDILLIDTIRMIPKPPYVVQPLDVLLLRVAEPLPNQPIEGTYTVAPDGTVNLGYTYGVVRVAGLTLEQVEEAVRRQIGRVLKDPQVAVGLAQFRGVQQVRGEHLVRPDGTVSLGAYGCVYVAGLTLAQAKVAIERHLSQYVLDPEVSVDVFAYNSKVFYVITDGAGYGQQVYRFPVTGKEMVLDAISFIQGLPAVASTKHIWVARPAPAQHGCVQILPVDWNAITQGASTCTNYQLFPGDRVYVKSDPLIRLDNALAKVLSPIERLFGVTLLGATTVRTISNNNNFGGGAAFVAPIR